MQKISINKLIDTGPTLSKKHKNRPLTLLKHDPSNKNAITGQYKRELYKTAPSEEFELISFEIKKVTKYVHSKLVTVRINLEFLVRSKNNCELLDVSDNRSSLFQETHQFVRHTAFINKLLDICNDQNLYVKDEVSKVNTIFEETLSKLESDLRLFIDNKL